ncbi:MAG TPA: gamma-glutamylcyclotransferase family protein [Mucilaginibacter sp.]|jgi:gamma-glutamylcyclotransferase (GGCT)/AIG2-like uncharacterized protein YtfP
METSSYLFVYGTLLDESNPFGAFLKECCSFYKKGKFKGKLFDLGEYPGAILGDGADHFVYGSIFLMNDPVETLKMLDDYEGFGNSQPQPNEFIRELAKVETGDETLNCWAYLYNLPVEGHWHIESGDYREYIKC